MTATSACAVLAASEYPNMRDNDEKALTYTPPPSETDVGVTGHPVVQLWLATDAQDLDIFVYLEEVDDKGNSTYITEGNLRVSHRALSAAPYVNLDLPYHSHYESGLEPIPAGEHFEVSFDLLATSYLFRARRRIRVTLALADAENLDTPALNPPPMLKLLRNARFPSRIELPVVHHLDAANRLRLADYGEEKWKTQR